MEEDRDKFAPLQKLLQDNTAIAGPSKDPNSRCYKEETMEISDSSDGDSSEEEETLKKKRTVGVKLPTHLKGLMGEANLRFARGDHATAEKMCFEVIRQCPHASEAYLTLAQLYETADPEKSFQYNMIAAHLRPRDVDQWLKIAQYYIDMGNLKQAGMCYSKAINANPNNIGLHRKRIVTLEVLGDVKAVIKYKVRLATLLGPKNWEEAIKHCVEAAEQYHSLKEYRRAIDALNIPFERFPKEVTPQLVNLMLDLLLLTKSYSKCLDIFVQFCDIDLVLDLVDDSGKINILSFTMPENLLIDLRIKFIICLIKLDTKTLALPLIDKLITEEDVEQTGDLYLDVGEALMSMNWHQDALKLLVPLVKSKYFSMAAVWLKHAECLNACGMYDEAIESYITVMTLAPQHAEVRYPLSMLLLKMGKKEEALKVLSQDPEKQELNAGILVKKMELLKQIGDFDEYYKTFELLLSRHSVIVEHSEELKALTHWNYPIEKIARIKRIRELRGDTIQPKPYFSSAGELSAQDEFELFKQVLQLCKDRGDYDVMEKFAFSVLTSSKLYKRERAEELMLLAFLACLYNKDVIHGYSLIREVFLRYPKNHLVFNLYNVILQLGMDIRYNRFLMRCLKNVIMSDKLYLLAGNYGMCVGNYNYAVQNYIYLFRKNQSPFLCLILGVLLIQCCSKRCTSNRKELTATALALFTQYANRRGVQALHEVKYNLGRTFHSFGMLHIAEIYYLDVLNYNSPLIEQYPHILDLKMEAAYNLHLIYKDSGNLEAARQVISNHLVI